MLYKFMFSKHFCNLNTFVLEKDFEYSHFSRLISFKSCQPLKILVGCSNRLHNPYKYENALSSTF